MSRPIGVAERTRFTALLLLFGCLLMTACGGSGGGGSGGGGERPRTASRPFALTEVNARQAIQVAFAPIEFSFLAVEYIFLVAEIMSIVREREVQVECEETPGRFITLTHVDNDNDGTISFGDVLRFSSGCFNLDSEVELTVERASVSWFHVDELEGAVDYKIATSLGEMNGAFALNYSYSTTESWSLTDVSVTSSIVQLGGRTTATAIEKTIADGRHYSIDANGQTDSDDLGGSFQFSTMRSFTGVRGRFPKEGSFILSAGDSRIRVMPAKDRELAREHAQYEIDATGTGQYGSATMIRWDSFLSGLLVDLTPNEPHTLTSVSITPERPDTMDDLAVAFEVSNPDRDELFVTFEWRRNGRLLDGYDYDVLPSDETKKGDVIEARVSISDGIAVSSDTASTTIVDTPPIVSVSAPLDVVEYGAQATFHAEASDIDGDAVGELAFLIDHGPAGMTVDPATGAVSWSASGPMFDRTTEVNWGVTVDFPGAVPATGTIRVNDPSRKLPLFRSNTEVPRSSNGLRIGDFDADGSNEALVAGEVLYELEAHGDAYRQSWAHPYLRTEAFATGDIDGDGRHEIIATSYDSLVRLDGVERRVVDSAELKIDVGGGNRAQCTDIELVDLDDDGSAELVCLASASRYASTLIVLDADGFDEIWRSETTDWVPSRMDVGNLDADPALEIVLDRARPHEKSNAGYVYDGSNFEVEWLYEGGFGDDVLIADVDGDGIGEIVASRYGSVSVYDAVTKQKIGEIGQSWGSAIANADISGDGIDDIFLTLAGHLRAYSFSSESEGFEKVFEYFYDSKGCIVTPRTAEVSDGFDHDDRTLPAYVTADSVGSGSEGFEPSHQNSQNGSGCAVDAARIGDIDSDGIDELLWGSYTNRPSDEFAVVELGESPAAEWSSLERNLDGRFVGGQLVRSDSAESRHAFATETAYGQIGGTKLVSIAASGDVATSGDLGENRRNVTSIFVSDYDHDASDEVFVGLGDKALVYDPFTNTSEWTTPAVTTLNLTGADFNADGRDDLVILGDRHVSVFDVFRQALIWDSSETETAHRLPARSALEVFDLDNDGSPEIVHSIREDLVVYSKAEGSENLVRTHSYSAESDIVDVALGDVDNDGSVDIFVLSRGKVYRLDSNFAFQKRLDFQSMHVESIMIERTSSQRKNLVVTSNRGFVVADPDSGAEIWRSPFLLGSMSRHSVRFHESDRFGRTRISVGTSMGMYITR